MEHFEANRCLGSLFSIRIRKKFFVLFTSSEVVFIPRMFHVEQFYFLFEIKQDLYVSLSVVESPATAGEAIQEISYFLDCFARRLARKDGQ